MATTGAKESAAAATAREQQDQEAQQALFEEKHAELVAEARRVAREHGVDVRTVAFLPGGAAAVQHEFLGVSREARVLGKIRRAVSRDVSAMGPEEVAAHERQLRMMRTFVERELQAKEAATARAAAAAAANRAPEKQAGGSKIKRVVIE